jgi:hypothetical protein
MKLRAAVLEATVQSREDQVRCRQFALVLQLRAAVLEVTVQSRAGRTRCAAVADCFAVVHLGECISNPLSVRQSTSAALQINGTLQSREHQVLYACTCGAKQLNIKRLSAAVAASADACHQ